MSPLPSRIIVKALANEILNRVVDLVDRAREFKATLERKRYDALVEDIDEIRMILGQLAYAPENIDSDAFFTELVWHYDDKKEAAE